MTVRLIAALALVSAVFLCTQAEARGRHHHGLTVRHHRLVHSRHSHVHRRVHRRRVRHGYLHRRKIRVGHDVSIAAFIRGRLVCAINVNAELARRGIRGTGSALAKSFLHWGRASPPVRGAVAVYSRRGGGHVAIVSRVVNGRVYVLNPSTRKQRWVETIYPRKAIAYRVSDRQLFALR